MLDLHFLRKHSNEEYQNTRRLGQSLTYFDPRKSYYAVARHLRITSYFHEYLCFLLNQLKELYNR